MIEKYNVLDSKQIEEINQLVTTCCQMDNVTLSYPLYEQEASHYLFREDDGTLSAVFSFLPYTDTTGECSAFTLPAFRRQGRFSQLLKAATEDFPESDILFPVAEECEDTMAVLAALEAQRDSCEMQMEITIPSDYTFTSDSYDIFGSPVDEETSSWMLVPNFGFCQTTKTSDDCVCLHHLEILPQFRQKGVGTVLVQLLLDQLAKENCRQVVLQVSGDNAAAVALYKKTGFRITETLSYYLY